MSSKNFQSPLASIEAYSDNIFWNQKKYQDLLELTTHILLPKDCRTIALCLESTFEFTAFLLSAWGQNKKVIPLKKDYFEKQLKDVTANINIDLIITEENKGNFFQDNKLSLTFTPSNLALLVLTSGSMGKSKLVALCLENLYHSARATIDFYNIEAADKWTLNLPLNHVGGIMIIIRALYRGFEVTDSINSGNIISLVPTQLQRLLSDNEIARKLSHYKAILLGGAACSKMLLESIKERKLPVSLTYGMTENCSQLCAFSPGQFPTLPGELGTVLPHSEIKIIDDRLSFKGSSLFKGYYSDNKFEETKTVDSYFQTQDLAIEKEGALILQGRADNVIISGGENVNLSEVRNQILELDNIFDCHILPIKSDEFGQVMIAFIKTSLKFEEVQLLLKKLLKPYEIPKYFYPLECVKIKGIKITREELKEYALEKGHLC